jgi:hypothetical protein
MKVSMVNSLLAMLEPDPPVEDGALEATGAADEAAAGLTAADEVAAGAVVVGLEGADEPEPELAPLNSAGPGNLYPLWSPE